MEDLLGLTWKVQVALVAGYGSYLIAYTGARVDHKAEDVLFRTLVFSLLATLAFHLTEPIVELAIRGVNVGKLATALIALTLPLAASLLWRWKGYRWLARILRKMNISIADDSMKAWQSLTNDRSVMLSQVFVRLKNGSTLICEDLSEFKDSPGHPLLLGVEGDVSMYVTHIKSKYGDVTHIDPEDLLHEAGHVVTYIPADQIVQIQFRRRKLD